MNWLNNLIRSDIRALAPYSSARDEALGFVPDIGLDANEFPWLPFGAVSALCMSNRYPEPQPVSLRRRLAALWSVDTNQILLGRGSDEGIDLLLRTFCEAGKDRIIICPPTYGMYKVAAAIQGAEVIKVPLTKYWQLDVPGILKSCTPNTKLIFIPSPNAPMGHLMKRDDILALCMGRAEQSLIVIDEAYIEFTDQPQGFVKDIEQHPNLVILRTLSKAHALAGERIGCVIAKPDLIHTLQKTMAPYPLTQSSIHAALDALSPNGLVQNRERRRLLVKERERMAAKLKQASDITHVYPSDANFLLVQAKNSKDLVIRLKQFGILVRDRHAEVPEAVRISIGTPEENNAVLVALGVNPETKMTKTSHRLASIQRKTKETAIDVTVNLDAPNFLNVETGIGFFNHMLMQLASHGGFGLELHCKGDLEIDQHHTIEDCALALGEAMKNALGDKRGITRFGFQAPLDEALANVTVDLSGRPYFVFNGRLPANMIGEMSGEMVPHFYRSLATALQAAIHVTLTGNNAHHMTEASFKATGRALRQAFLREGDSIPSTKGIL